MTDEPTRDNQKKGESPPPAKQAQESKGDKPPAEALNQPADPGQEARKPAREEEAPSTPESDRKDSRGAVVPAASAGMSIADKGSVNVEVPADALQQAVVQLQHLTALRQQEAERQERAIGNMEAALRRQGTMNRWLLTVSLLVVACGIVAVAVMLHLRTVNEQVSNDVQQLSGAVTATSQTVQESAEKQSRGLAEVSENVATSRAEQARMAAKIVTGVNETKETVTREVSKQTAAISKVEGNVAETKQVLQREAAATKEAVQKEMAATKQAVQKEVAKVGGELKATKEAVTREFGNQVEAISSVKQEVAATRAEQANGLAEVRHEFAETINKVASEQVAAIETVKKEVSATRDAQTRGLARVHTEVAAARTQSADLSKLVDDKIGKTEASITEKMEESVAALKAERDRVQAEVKRLLDERMKLLAEREIELHSAQEKLRVEEERVSGMATEAREEMRSIIANALRKLSEIKNAPPVGQAEKEPEEAQPREPTDERASDANGVEVVPEGDAVPAAGPTP